ncbi:SusC/RagA family TonB-linked outer membrane protein [Sinomicrobium sp. M5D2P17]
MRIKLKGFLTFFMALIVQLSIAQNKEIIGVVFDESQLPLPGASVVVKGTSQGVVTDFDGNFSISATEGDILEVSYVGYAIQEIVVTGQLEYTINLKPDNALDEVVVTALGIKREKRSLGYSQQSVTGDQVVQAKDVDINNALAGKVSGVQLVGSPSTSFNNALVRLRGQTGALYVVDGVKINNPSDINMEDVEDISILKGVAGTALYGTEARNGAIIITTKSARSGQAEITLDEGLSISSLYLLPEYQNQYGGGYSQEFDTYNGELIPNYSADESWGPELDGRMVRHWDSWIEGTDEYGKLRAWSPQSNNVRDFYRTGVTNNLTLSFLKGGEDYNIKAIVNNLNTELIYPNSKREQTTASFKASYNVTEKLKFLGNFNYQYRFTFNNPDQGYGSIGSNFNQWWQRQLDVKRLRNYRRNGQIVSWNMKSVSDPTPLYWNSPYFEVYENLNHETKNSVYGSIGLEYEVNDDLTALVDLRRTSDIYNYDDRAAWGGLEVPWYKEETWQTQFTELYMQLSYDKSFGDFDLIATVGAQWNQRKYKWLKGETVGGLQIPNYYSVNTSVDPVDYDRNSEHEKNYSGFVTASLGYKNFLYLDGSFRRDYSSAADMDDNALNVYGISTSFIFSHFIPEDSFLSFGKIRAGLAQAPGFPSVYSLLNGYSIKNPYGGSVSLGIPTSLNNPYLKGGIREEKELGTELRFLRNRLGLDFTYYNRIDKELPSSLTLSGATGYYNTMGNQSRYETNGWELALTGTPVQTDNFSWNVAFNIAGYNKKVMKINDLVDRTSVSNVWNLYVYDVEGSKAGDIYGYVWKRDENGKVLINDQGTMQYTDNLEKVGNIQPDFTGGFNNMFRYKNFDLSFSMDFQKGGSFYSVTKMFNASAGVGAETVGVNDLGNQIRDAVVGAGGEEQTYLNANEVASNSGGVRVDGVDAQTGEDVSYYVKPRTYFGSLYGIGEEWVYDASYVKLRQVRLGYNLPKEVTEKLPFSKVYIGVYANNLWLIYSKVDGIDPSEIEEYPGYDGGQDLRWVEGGQSPSQRTFGFNVKLTF